MMESKKVWKGIFSEEDYYILTGQMTEKEKAEFDKGLENIHKDPYPEPRITINEFGLYDPANKAREKKGEKAEVKDYRRYLEFYFGRKFPNMPGTSYFDEYE